jgi:hypothetical protein
MFVIDLNDEPYFIEKIFSKRSKTDIQTDCKTISRFNGDEHEF